MTYHSSSETPRRERKILGSRATARGGGEAVNFGKLLKDGDPEQMVEAKLLMKAGTPEGRPAVTRGRSRKDL